MDVKKFSSSLFFVSLLSIVLVSACNLFPSKFSPFNWDMFFVWCSYWKSSDVGKSLLTCHTSESSITLLCISHNIDTTFYFSFKNDGCTGLWSGCVPAVGTKTWMAHVTETKQLGFLLSADNWMQSISKCKQLFKYVTILRVSLLRATTS